jgi:hypothetical protein
MLRSLVRTRRWGVFALTGATVMGTVAVVGAGTAWAVASPGTYAGAEAPTSVNEGATNQAASDWLIQLENDFTPTTTVSLQVIPPAGTNCGAAGQSLGFHATPTVTVLGAESDTGGTASTSDTAPTITATLSSSNANCLSEGVKDTVTLSVGNFATGTSTDEYELQVGAVAYDVGSAAGTGNVGVTTTGLTTNGSDNTTSGTATTAGLASVPMTGNGNLSNATITNVVLAMGPTGVGDGSTGNALANFSATETVPGVVPATSSGALSLLEPAAAGLISPQLGTFTGTATVTVTGFTVAALNSSNACPSSGSSSASVVAGNGTNYSGSYAGWYPFCLYGPTTSTTGPGRVTVSGITYSAAVVSNGPTVPPWTVNVALIVGASTYTTSGQPPISVIWSPRIAGFSADDTAAAAAEATMDNESMSSLCGKLSSGNGGGAVILASDAEYQDALSASFLGYADLPSQGIGGGTNTGNDFGGCNNPILLNPPTPPPGGEATTAAAGAIRKLGASTVYIVGGTDAISSDVATQLGQIQIGTFSSGAPQYLQVIRIAGTTAEETAADVAQYPATCRNGSSISSTFCDSLVATPGAYGMYNSGASESSSGPTSSVPTAILADADEFQDALAASPLAYNLTLPVLLTSAGALDPNAQAAITNMGIKQVIVVGGSAAVSDAVVSTLEGMGVSVLRIAGTTFDATSTELASFILNDYTKGSVASPGTVDGLGSPADDDPTGVDYLSLATNDNPPLTVGIARGDSYQDALTSAQVLGWSELEPLLLNTDTSTPGPAVAAFLGSDGTGPNGGLVVYTNNAGATATRNVFGLDVFGGTFAQTPSLVQSELDDIAAG